MGSGPSFRVRQKGAQNLLGALQYTNDANDFNLDLAQAWTGFTIDTFNGVGDPDCAP